MSEVNPFRDTDPFFPFVPSPSDNQEASSSGLSKEKERLISNLKNACVHLWQTALKIYAYCLKCFLTFYRATKAFFIDALRFVREGKKGKSAVKIQAVCRGFLAKRKKSYLQRNLLPSVIWEEAATRLKSGQMMKNCMRATCGNTPVYLPQDLPVVFKQSGKGCEKRAQQMSQARRLCEQNGLTHLVVPKLRQWESFLIESRLPIPIDSFEEQMEIYVQNLPLFIEAAKEFTRFVFLANVGDIASNQLNTIGPNARYDNYPLYVEEGRGKVGLIDLELCTFDLETTYSGDERETLSRCKSAILLFPYHFQDIIETAKEYDFRVGHENLLRELEEYRDKAQNFYKRFYLDHLTFLQEKRISFNNPTQIVEVSQERKEQIRQAFFDHIENGLPEPAEPDLRKTAKDKEAFVTAFTKKMHIWEAVFPKIVDSIREYLKESIDENRNGKTISSYSQLMRCRWLSFKRGDGDWYGIKQQLYRADDRLSCREDDDHLTLAIKVIFLELSKGGEISFYEPGNRSSHYAFF